MHSIKNISERNKIDSQSWDDAYISLDAPKSIHETAKNPKNPLVWAKNPKKPTGCFFFKTRVFSNPASNLLSCSPPPPFTGQFG